MTSWLAIGAVIGGALALTRATNPPWLPLVARIAAGVAAVYLASAIVVDVIALGFATRVGRTELRTQSQVGLSITWSLLGVGAFVVGIRRASESLRLLGLALLALATAKVFLFDLAALDVAYRAMSLLVLGVVLLSGAWWWQRQRRRPDPRRRATTRRVQRRCTVRSRPSRQNLVRPPLAHSPPCPSRNTAANATSGRRRSRRPARTAASRPGPGRFVVQRHRATRLHYDFRLEIDGVLGQLGRAEGPDPRSQDPAAWPSHVEDHPIEYFDFEGVIPAKQYGAGDVIVWDWGTWEPEAPTLDADEGDRGRRAEVRPPRARSSRAGSRSSARAGARAAAPTARSRTTRASSGCSSTSATRPRQDGLGRRGLPAEREDRPHQRRGQGRTATPLDQPGAGGDRGDRPRRRRRPRRCPSASSRCSPRSPTKPFDDDDWLYEIKWDGFRVQAVVYDGKVRIWTRNLNDAAAYFPKLLSPPTLDRREPGHRRWRGRGARRGRPAGLQPAPDQARRQEHRAGSCYQAFDLLYLDGRSLLDVPLEDRKRLLRSVLKEHPRVRLRVARRAARAWRSTRRPRPAASRASSPSSAGRATSPGDGPAPG